MPDDIFDFDRDDPGDAEHVPAEPRDLDPRLQAMIENVMRFLNEAKYGPMRPLLVQQNYKDQSSLQMKDMIENVMCFLNEAKYGPMELLQQDYEAQSSLQMQATMIENVMSFPPEAKYGPMRPVGVQLDYKGQSGLQNLAEVLAEKLEALAEKLSIQPQKPDAGKELPTIWYHGNNSYSADGGNPKVVSNEQHNLLSAFLDKEVALDTKALQKAGVENVAAAVGRIADKFGAAAIRRPAKKGDGYFIRVRTLLLNR
jgi:hypothetical protein